LSIAGEVRFLAISDDGRRLVEQRPALARHERRLAAACARSA
jgi:hypothetical protein